MSKVGSSGKVRGQKGSHRNPRINRITKQIEQLFNLDPSLAEAVEEGK